MCAVDAGSKDDTHHGPHCLPLAPEQTFHSCKLEDLCHALHNMSLHDFSNVKAFLQAGQALQWLSQARLSAP